MLEARVLTKTQTEKPESLARTVPTIIAELNVEIALETVILTQNANFKGRNFGCFFRHIHRHTLSAS